MAIEGMDVEQVRNIGHQLQQQGHAINSVISTVDRLINEAESVWKGNDATQFRDWWTSQHRPHLVQVEQAIAGLGQSAINNAQEQANVSGH